MLVLANPHAGGDGAGLQVCPGADPTDGMLEVTVVGPAAPL